MKKIYLAACAAMMTFTVNAENVENEINSTSEAQASENYDAENGVVTIGSDRMFQIESKDGKFSFKPYLMIQSTANFHYYDDEGLDKAYNQDNVANSGFAMPYAVLGFTGKAFSNITYNLSINAAASGANILTSLTATTIMPYSLNAVCPKIGTGFDMGVMIHGKMNKQWGYELGMFNGTGAGSNSATKTFSDDWHIPSLLYAGRIAWTPFGTMPRTQGNAKMLNENKLEVALSGSVNVESESESTNDTRMGFEVSYLHNRWYFSGEAYWMNVGFTKRQKIDETYDFIGGYVQAGYFIAPQWQLAARYDFMDRNGSSKDGVLNMPAVGCNYFIKNSGIKLSAMYQYIGRTGHETQLDRDNDDLGVAKHSAVVMLQYTF